VTIALTDIVAGRADHNAWNTLLPLEYLVHGF